MKHVVTVSAILQNPQGKILVLQEKDPRVFGKYNLPGGHLEEHECLLDGAIREVKEETDIDISPEYLLGFYQWKKKDPGISFVFYAPVQPIVPHIDPNDILAYHWLDLDEILLMLDGQFLNPVKHQQIFEDFVNGQRIELRCLKDIIIDPSYG
jgi:phosphatase NudJ